MGEIRHRQPAPSAGIEYGEIHIPDDQDFGTGTFTTEFQAGAIAPAGGAASTMVNAPRFQVSVTIDAKANRISAVVGTVRSQPPAGTRVFAFPPKTDLTVANVVAIQFSGWKVTQLSLNGQVLPAIN